MNLVVRPYAPSDAGTLLEVLRSPGIREQYDMFDVPDGATRMLGGPYTPLGGVHLAYADGEPAGFAYAILLPGPPHPWSLVRGGVRESFRRRGVARALYSATRVFVLAQQHTPGICELTMSAWEPFTEAQGMIESLGYRHDRWFWLMERPREAAPPEVAWPAGVTVRVLDGSDAALADWNDAFNESFAGQYRYVPSPLEHVHELARQPGFRADGVLLAYRDGRVAGFCRNELYGGRGEVGTLGTTPAARGIGLGRALLRWGVGWLEAGSALPVTLLVDGQNETAQRLYRSEGFEVTRTRRIWSLPLTTA